MRVSFDKAISLKEGNRGGPPPRVKELVCSKDVRIENRTLDGDRLVRYQRMVSEGLEMSALEPEDAAANPDAASEGNEIPPPAPARCACSSAAARTPWPRRPAAR